MKKSKLFKLLLITVLLFMVFSFSASAENYVTDIDIDVTLNEDGSAQIHQAWECDFDEGTECYYVFDKGDKLTISDFTVSLNGEEYTTLDYWDVDASFSDKEYTCGLNEVDSDTVEVCWGISQYGQNTYEIDYTVHNVVAGYTDSDGFNFRFINDEMNTGPTKARVNISLWNGEKITDENCNIWAFGYDGQIEFQNGKVVAYTESDLDYYNHVTLMLEFKKGIFAPAVISGDSFETLKDEALNDSDYGNYYESTSDIVVIPDSGYTPNGMFKFQMGMDSILEIGFILIFVVGFGGFTAFFIYYFTKLSKEKKKKKQLYENAQYYRDVPPKSELNKSYALLTYLKDTEESTIISARILSLIASGVIEPIRTADTLDKEKVSFRITDKDNSEIDKFDKKLLDILVSSAGDDGILEPKEMKEYCNSHPKTLRYFLDDCKANGRKLMNAQGYGKKEKYSKIADLTDRGIEELQKLYGLKKYLLEFSLVGEKAICETVIWQDYMIYASLFGIADKVSQELKKLFPNQSAEIEIYQRDLVFADICRANMYINMKNTEKGAVIPHDGTATGSFIGGGGGASFSGGSGFSGGGTGGGTR